jgi:hypothetical protein
MPWSISEPHGRAAHGHRIKQFGIYIRDNDGEHDECVLTYMLYNILAHTSRSHKVTNCGVVIVRCPVSMLLGASCILYK